MVASAIFVDNFPVICTIQFQFSNLFPSMQLRYLNIVI